MQTGLDAVDLQARFLDVAEVAEVLGVSVETVYRLLRAGDLRSLKVRARRKIDPASVRSYLRAGLALPPDVP